MSGGRFPDRPVGFQQRTEFNKRILKISEDASEITPQVGFLHYGVLKNPYILVKGSIPPG